MQFHLRTALVHLVELALFVGLCITFRRPFEQVVVAIAFMTYREVRLAQMTTMAQSNFDLNFIVSVVRQVRPAEYDPTIGKDDDAGRPFGDAWLASELARFHDSVSQTTDASVTKALLMRVDRIFAAAVVLFACWRAWQG
jgi:hypothetical protein